MDVWVWLALAAYAVCAMAVLIRIFKLLPIFFALASAYTAVAIPLKWTDTVDWSWWWVLLPPFVAAGCCGGKLVAFVRGRQPPN